MARLSVRYLEVRLSVDGTKRYIFNPPRDAKKAGILLTTSLGTDFAKAVEQAEKYNALLDIWRKEKKTITEPVHVAGSLNSLVDEYLASRHYAKLTPISQKVYRLSLTELCGVQLKDGRTLGEIHINRINRRVVDAIYEKLQRHDEAGNPTRLAYANKIMTVASSLWWVAGRWEYVTGDNPFSAMKRIGTGKRHVVWTPEQLEIFKAKAVEMGYRSIALAFTMQYELAQRQGDVLSLMWSNYNGTHVDFEQSKTGREMWLPVSAELKAMLDATPRASTYIVASEFTQRPFSGARFRGAVREIREAAGLPSELTSLDLRRTAATEMGDAGATEAEIMSVGGWTNPSTVQRYKQRTDVQAGNALQKRWNKRDDK
jgi:integrase